ncbi:MAG: C39 family peptidase [Anaerolineales bacterium]
MLESERKARNAAKLQELHPVFRQKIEAVLAEMESYQLRPRIQEAWRSPEDQLRAFREGRSRLEYSFHNVTAPDGTKEALAADIIDDNRPLGPKLPYILHLAAAAENQGLTTGIYFDLPPDKIANIKRALAAKDWNAPVHIGWDPLHVQVADLTIEAVRAGARPQPEGGAVAVQPPVSAGGTAAGTPAEGGSASGGGETGASVASSVPAPASPHLTRYRVLNSKNDRVVEYDLGTALRPATLLPVPYISQLGPGADAHRNDCGAASAAMLLAAYLGIRMTPDEFYTRFNFQGDAYLSQLQIRNAMSSLGLLTDFRANLTYLDLFTFLASSKPVIALIRYKVLAEAGLTERPFQGPHFAVVVGIDCKYVYVHDPLYTDPAAGEARPYPLDIFWQAWKEVALVTELPNPERSAIIPTAGIGFRLARRVRVTAASLNVRAGPGGNYPAVGVARKDEIYEVTRELNGWGEIGENRWIALTYTIAAA